MDYLTYFGSKEEQIRDIEKAEDEMLLRKIISIGIFSDILKKKKVSLFISDNRYGSIEICGISEIYENHYGFNSIEFMLATNSNWGLENDFIETNLTFIKSLSYINTLMKEMDSSKINLLQKVFIDSSSHDWLKLIFEVLEKKYLYQSLMSKILDSELERKEDKNEIVKI